VNHQDACTTGFVQKVREPRERIAIHREVDTKRPEHTVRLDEIALHVDEQQRRVRRVDGPDSDASR